MKKLKWTAEIQIEVDSSWVSDGFDLDRNRLTRMLNDMIENELPYALYDETDAKCLKIVKKPSRKIIKKLQGEL